MVTPRHLLVASLLIGATSIQADVPWRTVRGADLRAMFIDHELGDGVHYAYQFRGDGALTGFAMGKEIHGTWMQRKFTAVEECFEVERRGNQIRFLRDGYEALSGNLSPIKAQVPTRVPR